MCFKIKVNYRNGSPANWWLEDSAAGITTKESEASAYTAEEVEHLTQGHWFNQDRDAGSECWLSLKLVP